MNVLFVTNEDLAGASGGNIATRELAAALAAHEDVTLSLICPTEPADLPARLRDAATVAWTLPEKTDGVAWHAQSQPSWIAGLARVFSGERPDLVVARAGASMVAPPLVARLAGIPYVLLVRGMVSRNLKFQRAIDQVVRLNVRLADEVFVAYEAIADAIEDYRGGLQSPIRVAPNAVDPDVFTPEDQSAARSAIGLDVDEEFVVGFVGSLKERHCVEQLVRAVGRLREERDCHLLVVGDGPLRESLESLVADLDLTDAVTFAGFVDHDSVNTYVCACDALYGVVDPEKPSNPIKCYEYLACERPILTTRTPEFSFVERESVGVTLDAVDVESVRAGLARLADLSPAERTRLGRRGREYVVENHTWAQVVETVLESVE